ncbi:MAG: formyltetrahydrofolate deformylase [Actinomycetes bacterium]
MTEVTAPTRVILLVSAPDRPGLVADTTAYVRDVGGNIEEAEQHSTSGGVFVQRMQLAVPGSTDLEQLRAGVAAITAGDVTCHEVGARTRAALFVSRAGHAAYDVMSRVALGSLPIEVVCIVSDHSDHADLARRFDVPFLGIPVEGRSREEHEAEVLRSITPFGVELIVLARYMRILTADFLERAGVPAINVHHSLLPAFIGAGAYQRAWDRGVKLIGATAHYATVDLDEGPIIAQAATGVSHRDDPEDLARRGRELESAVLAQAIAAHCEFRVVLVGHRTIIFED